MSTTRQPVEAFPTFATDQVPEEPESAELRLHSNCASGCVPDTSICLAMSGGCQQSAHRCTDAQTHGAC